MPAAAAHLPKLDFDPNKPYVSKTAQTANVVEKPGVIRPQRAVAALNAGVEAIARRDFAQYQWTYKRYTLRPAGSGEENPYLDLY